MSSENRSSSAVRNLRSLFENKHGDSPSATESRGRSPSTLSATTGDTAETGGLRRTSKVRASFVPVEAPANMASLQPSESNAGRRGSFGEADGDLDLKKTLHQGPPGPETAISSVAGTPLVEPTESQVRQTVEDKEPENPDKPTTGAEEEPINMKPADPASSEAVSGGQALPPVAEDLRNSTSQKTSAAKEAGKKPAVNGTSKPAAISTKAPSKAAPAIKSPASAKSPSSATSASKPAKTESLKPQPAKAPLRKPSRSSLTAPTAASMARSGPGDKSASAATAKAKPREPTKPVSLPSHLTAPTASSRAKHEPETQAKPASTNLRASTMTKPKPSTTATGTKSSRSSLAPDHRPGSRTSTTSTAKRSTAPADGSFLERMMKPTAASASKTHEKTEVKSPPRQKAAAPAPAKSKVNGVATKAKDALKKVDPTRKGEDEEEKSSTAASMPSAVPFEEPKEEHISIPAPIDLAGPQQEPEVVEEHQADAPEPTSTPAATVEEPAQEPEATSIEAAATESAPVEEAPKATEPLIPTGSETPQGAGETATRTTDLEATPAGLGDEETIR